MIGEMIDFCLFANLYENIDKCRDLAKKRAINRTIQPAMRRKTPYTCQLTPLKNCKVVVSITASPYSKAREMYCVNKPKLNQNTQILKIWRRHSMIAHFLKQLTHNHITSVSSPMGLASENGRSPSRL